MFQWENFQKKCATCANWGGNRKTSNFGRRVETDSQATQGACYKCPLKKQANDSCSNYEKWSALK